MRIEHLSRVTLYANPAPLLVSRQAAFPGVVLLPSGDLLAMFSIGQAFDAADMRAYLCRSSDGGATWSEPWCMHDGTAPESESFKPVLLPDGRLLATGYVFERPDPLTPIADPETGALLPMRTKVAWSEDGGATWTTPRAFSVRDTPLELSGPAIVTADGRLLAAAAPFHLGRDGHEGWLIESRDNGESWDRLSIFFRAPGGRVAPWECRLCELAPGRVTVQFWAYDATAQANLDVHLVLSEDGGQSFGPAIATGIRAQASNLMPLGPDRFLAIHAHRETPAGLTVRAMRLTGGGVEVEADCQIFGGPLEARSGEGIVAQFGSLRFGQPALLPLGPGQVLATCWTVEACQHVIRGDHLRLADAG